MAALSGAASGRVPATLAPATVLRDRDGQERGYEQPILHGERRVHVDERLAVDDVGRARGLYEAQRVARVVEHGDDARHEVAARVRRRHADEDVARGSRLELIDREALLRPRGACVREQREAEERREAASAHRPRWYLLAEGPRWKRRRRAASAGRTSMDAARWPAGVRPADLHRPVFDPRVAEERAVEQVVLIELPRHHRALTGEVVDRAAHVSAREIDDGLFGDVGIAARHAPREAMRIHVVEEATHELAREVALQGPRRVRVARWRARGSGRRCT